MKRNATTSHVCPKMQLFAYEIKENVDAVVVAPRRGKNEKNV